MTITSKESLKGKSRKEQIEGLYRLSGLQEGMLFHGLYDEGVGAYINQFGCDLIRPDLPVFRQSWEHVLKQHSILRSAFYHDKFKVPVQCVFREVELPVEILDYRGMNEVQQAAAIQQYEGANRGRGFDFKVAPLMRIALLRLSEDRYRMLWTYHHILFDGWSMQVLMEEFLRTYELLISGKKIVIGQEDRYQDYIRYIERRDKDQEQRYWCHYLQGVEQGTLLPFIGTTAERNKGVGFYKSALLQIDAGRTAKMQSYAQRHRITVNTLMQGVWSYLLHRYTGSSDIIYGVIVSGRPDDLPGVEHRVGMYINTLPLRSRMQPEESIVKWLQQIQEDQVSSRQHQHTPLHAIQGWSAVQGDLFDSLLVFDNYPASKLISSRQWGLDIENVQVQEYNNYPLSINIFSGQETGLLFSYNTALLAEEYARQICSHFEYVLLQIIDKAEGRLADIDLLSPAEKHQLLYEFNATVMSYPRDRTIVDIFEEQVLKTPGNIALVFEGEGVSYLELNQRANRLAHYLRGKGVREETLVPICIERSLEMIIGILGILKAGGAYVPLDTDFPPDRLSYMLGDTGARIVVSSKASSSRLPDSLGIEVIEMDDESSVLGLAPSVNLPTHVGSDHLAYVIYTSGSTGRPKGVMIEHRSLVDYVFGLKQALQIDQCRSFALVSTIATDLGNTVIYSSLLVGGSLHLFSKETVSNVDVLQRYFEDQGIDCLKIVPSHWRALSMGGRLLLPVKLLIFGGESLQAELVEEIRLSASGCRIVNHYGPTETTIGKLLHVVKADIRYTHTIPVGRPFSNTQVYVLSKDLSLCAPGIGGQLYIGGDGVSRGYVNNAGLTGEKFINNPFDPSGSGVMYATGDLVKYLPDGNIVFLGRVDDQVKIRGYRVELGEIESVLLGSGLVSQAVVLARSDKEGKGRLVGYIVAADGVFDKEAIGSYVRDKLPEYMVPAVWVEVEGMPLTANGKVDKKALPDPDAGEVLRDRYVAPGNAVETTLAGIWKEVLEVEQVGIHDDFFELGGHSLLAVRLISLMRKELSVEMPISDIFDYPTIALLSGQLESQSGRTILPSIKAEARPEHIPLSFSQERLWFIDQLEGSVQYHVPGVLGLKGRVNPAALQYALGTIVNRHEVLRTVILQKEGQPFQSIKDKDGWRLDLVGGYEFVQNPAALQQYIEALINAPFDLSGDHMLRGHLITLTEDKHVLVVTLHHIASDAWSRSVLVKEVVELYGSYEASRPPRLSPLSIQYADYAMWQRKYLEGDLLDRKLGYWKQKLQGVAPLQLPTDYSRPAVQSTQGASKGFLINKELLSALQILSQQQGATLFMTLLAAFKVLLYRYSGQQDICVGSPIAGRQQQEVEDLIGFFVNTLALRSEVRGDASFSGLLNQLKATTLEAYEHQEVPFEKVVDAVVRERDMSRNPLFQVMFVWQNTPEVPELRLGELILSREEYEQTTSKFDLILFITETLSGLSGSVEYSTDLYSEPTIVRMIGHFEELLTSIVKQPDQRIGELPMLGQGEKDQLLEEFNNTGVEYSVGESISGLFEEQVEKTPDQVAVVLEEQELTYKELNERSNQLARYLKTKGVKEDTLVPICIERSAEMIVGILGILKAGGAYVPIDPDYPSERIDYMVEDSRATLIVSSKRSRSKLPGASSLDIIELDGDRPLINGELVDNLGTGIKPHHLAYVLYTSGSTGKPKGVKMSGGSLVNLLRWQQKQFENTSRRVLQFASLNFDVSFQEIFSTLCFGSGLYLIDGERRKDMSEVLKDLGRYSITHLFIPYIVLKNLSEYIGSISKASLCLQEVIVAGEQLKFTEDIQDFIIRYSINLINQYGPTEAHVVSSYRVNSKVMYPLPPIGKPVDNTQIYISRSNQLSPIGVSGEICIGGVQVAAGYLNRGDLTAEKFIANPFSKEPGARIYKTGDLGRWLPDGNIEYLGRMDDQVKIRGYRVELGEIESMLQECRYVNKAVVLAREYKGGGKQLVGYVVSEGSFDPVGIVSFLKSKLPEYMVPALWVELESLPLTPNGKIDRKVLPDPADAGESLGVHYTAPRNKEEALIAEIWQKLLQVERAGIHDNFFELGGHSLLATRVISSIRNQLEVELAIKDLFLHPTIAELASHLREQSKGLILPAIKAAPRPELIPLSFSQERLWFIDRLEGSVQYHMPAVLGLTGNLNRNALVYALRTIVERHEVLRTVIRETDGQGFQNVLDQGGWQLDTVEGVGYKEGSEELQQYIEQLINAPFDLSEDHMLRATLIRLHDEEHVLVVTVHHIASDGWSLSIIVKELVELYGAYVENRPVQLSPLEMQYADYAIWQRRYLQGEILDKKIGYWKEKLRDVSHLQLPTDYSRPAVWSIRGDIKGFRIDKELLGQIQAISRQQGTTLFMTLLAVFKVLMYRYSGQQDICVGSAIAGRQQQEAEGLIGFFVNSLALRSEISAEVGFTEFLQQVKTTILEAYEHQEVPFETVVDAVVKQRDMSRNPLFQVMFVLQNTPKVPRLRLGEMQLSDKEFKHTTAQFDLSFRIAETVSGLQGSVEYCTDLFNEATIDRMMGHYKELLSSVVKQPQQSIGVLPLLSGAEEHQLLMEFNDRAVDYPKDKTIVDLFEEQAARSPHEIAVTFEQQQLTYRQLNERANQLSHYLRNKGVEEETLVAICIERSVEMIVGILGILKAGGAYVPIDPQYPEERIGYMLEDTRATIVISSQDSKGKLETAKGFDIIELDSHWAVINKEPITNLQADVESHHLAYVIYTSGSTGKPKGAMIEHRNVIRLFKTGSPLYDFNEKDVWTMFHSFCFDFSVWEMYGALFYGGRLVIVASHVTKDTILFSELLLREKVTILNQTPSAFYVLQDCLVGKVEAVAVRYVIFGGEALNAAKLHPWKQAYTNCRLINMYGITETTVHVTYQEIEWQQIHEGRNIIGKPIPTLSSYIVDGNQKLVPIGIGGEIYIGGAGLARGYLNREELTAEKFLRNPFDEEAGSRVYKTGDLGRWLADGTIEYLGRIDDQVKIRGYRIELGEIESVLQQSELVNQAVVLKKQDNEAGNRLVCYVVPNWQVVKAKERELYQRQIAGWKELYNTEYSKTEGEESVNQEFNIVGWNDSFTGNEIPAEQMRDWLQDIIEVILAEQPANVLEIGCGTGLIYYQLAGKVKKYIGSDFSSSCVHQITQHINKGLRDYGPTELKVCSAHEVLIKEEQQVDTIILNSIVQYFPGEDYMSDIIAKSISLLKGRGRIIIGDVRDNRLLKLFKSRLNTRKVDDSVSIKKFKWAVEQETLKEEELCFSPEYFYRLKSLYPQITHVEIQWKQGSYINELTLYRYTVVLYVGLEKKLIKPQWKSWNDLHDKQSIIVQLQEGCKEVALKDVPNPRLWRERLLGQALQDTSINTVGDLLQTIENEDKESVEINLILNAAKANGYRYMLFLDENPLLVNILIELNPKNNFIEQIYSEKGYSGNSLVTNIPLFTNIGSLLLKDIKSMLQQRLPEYMVPLEMTALSQLPLTSNGKADRKFLSEIRDGEEISKLNYQPPGTDIEQALANIWQELLGLERVGIHNNFFELGGHSLLAVRVISSIRNKLEVELSIKDLFSLPTIAELAGHLQSQSKGLLLPAIKIQTRPERIPLSFSQERVWFIDCLEGSVQYHIPAVLRLKGKLNKEALTYSLQNIVNRHEILRTVYLEVEGQAYQHVKDKDGWQLFIVEGSRYQEDREVLHRYIRQLVNEPFDLSKDYMLKGHLIAFNDEEHVLVVTIHHIACDGWSMAIIVKEISELYNSYEEDRAVELVPSDIQYADYALWQRKYFQGDLFDNKIRYWKEKLQGVAPLQMPTDYIRPAVQSTKGAVLLFQIDQSLSEDLKMLSRQQGTTLFMTLLAAFKVLLHRYSSQDDICVGSPIANRTQQEMEQLIGFFINTLALRNEVRGNASFIELLQQVRTTTLEAYEHQEVPFEKVVEAVVKERDMSRSSLFQVMFVLQNVPEALELQLGKVQLLEEGFTYDSAKFDLTLYMAETTHGLKGSVEYCVDLYNEDTIVRMMAHFKELLSSIVKAPAQKIGALSMLSGAEEHQLFVEFNNTYVRYTEDLCIVDLFEEQVAKTPARIALAFEGKELSYQDLNERANQLAHYLCSKGVKEETLVPICLERNCDMIIGILGILKASGAYVPIDPAYPQERISYLLNNTKAAVVVSSKESRLKLQTTEDINIIEIDGDWPVISMQPTANLEIDIERHQLAYVIFTSGSTGKPKGVMVEHRSVVNLLLSISNEVQFKSDSSFLSVTTFSFDICYLEFFMPLICGGKLIIVPKEVAEDGFRLAKSISHYCPSHMQGTPSTWQLLLDCDWENTELIKILIGGEAVKGSLKDQLTRRGNVFNLYGPTETTIWSTIKKLEVNQKVSIGNPLANTVIYIVNKEGRLAPIGVPGEICISGSGLARGYLNHPELTAEKFIANPFNDKAGSRMYKTGDTGRWLPNGNIEYLGRMDEQVKIRGYRIELGEIESTLNQSEFVRQAVVVAREDGFGNNRLVCYVVSNEGFDREVVKNYLRGKLPEFMVPVLWVELEQMPLTPNGKVDRKALPDFNTNELISKEYVAPRNELEIALAEIWQELLGVESVGIYDNFFEMGGAFAIGYENGLPDKKRFMLSIPIQALFQFASINDLSNYLEWEHVSAKEEDTTGFEIMNI